MKNKLTPKRELSQLQIDLEVLNGQRNNIQERISQLEDELEMPALIKRFKGKYFKYRNCYSGDNWWWLYSYCIDIKDHRTALLNSFQTCHYGENNFKIGDLRGFDLFAVQITKREYITALRKFLKNADRLNQ